MFLAVLALLMCCFPMSIARRALYLLPSTFSALELVSHIWVLPDVVDHGCALLEDVGMEMEFEQGSQEGISS